MSSDKPKSINSLMAHMRNTHGISIKGSSHKRKLRNIGYYHGFKGYRFIGTPNNTIAFGSFDEILAIYDFDKKLKTLLYPHIMFIETALKNYVLEVILEESKSFNFNDVYQNLLTGFKNHPIGSANYSKSIKNRLAVRDIVYRELTSNYDRLPVKHYCDKDESVPMWAIFEVLNLGQFGFFTSCLSDNVKIKVSHELGLPPQCNTGGSLLPVIVFTLKDIRNSIAHNNVIFDARFKSGDVKRSLSRCLEMSTSIQNITFGNIFDYIILVVYILKCLRVSKSEINKLVSSFEEMTEQLRRSVPVQIYSRIIPTNTRRDLVKLSIFVRS